MASASLVLNRALLLLNRMVGFGPALFLTGLAYLLLVLLTEWLASAALVSNRARLFSSSIF